MHVNRRNLKLMAPHHLQYLAQVLSSIVTSEKRLCQLTLKSPLL